MPIYSYICSICGEKEDAFRKIAEMDDAPLHCSTPMERRITATMIAPGFTPYRAIAVDKEVGKRPFIRSRDEHRAFLARNGYQEVGNDKSMAPPSREEIMDRKPEPAKNVEYDLSLDTMDASH